MKKTIISILIVILSFSTILFGYDYFKKPEILCMEHTPQINYELYDSVNVVIVLYDVTGTVLDTLVNEKQGEGYHEVEYDFTNFDSGVYLYQIVTKKMKKMVLLK
jgi:hypothetical protein